MKLYNFEKIVLGQYETNCYLLYRIEDKSCLIIDPGDNPKRIKDILSKLELKPEFIFLTHGHFDHCGAAQALKDDYDTPIILHKNDHRLIHSSPNIMMAETLGLNVPAEVDVLFNQDFTIRGFEEVKIIFTPGHSPGSVCLLVEGALFSGDTVFSGSIGRTDLPGGDFKMLEKSLERVKNLPPETKIYPGHGEDTHLAQEIKFNPFF